MSAHQYPARANRATVAMAHYDIEVRPSLNETLRKLADRLQTTPRQYLVELAESHLMDIQQPQESIETIQRLQVEAALSGSSLNADQLI